MTTLIVLVFCVGLAALVVYMLHKSASQASLKNIGNLYEQDKQEILKNPKPHWLYKSLNEAKNKDVEELLSSQALFISRPKFTWFK